MAHDDNFHKYLVSEIRSIKRGQSTILKKFEDLPCGVNEKAIAKNTNDLGWMKRVGFYIIGALGILKVLK